MSICGMLSFIFGESTTNIYLKENTHNNNPKFFGVFSNEIFLFESQNCNNKLLHCSSHKFQKSV